MRLLVIGAGATIAEAEMIRTGRGKELPTMADFCKKLFQGQPIVQWTIALYLTDKGIPYNPALIEYLNSKSQQPISHEKITPTPLEVFIQLEEKTPEIHNVETIFEYAWNQFGKTQPNLWDDLIYWTIYEGIFPPFTSIFHENGVGYKKMFAGAMLCKHLTPEDAVLSLNYDTCFDLAIKQSLHNYCYAPNQQQGAIRIYKPHGSLNLFVNRVRQLFMFCDPEQIPGTITEPDPEGGEWEGKSGIIPPRLNKDYSQHPIAKSILQDITSHVPNIVSFWGVGLTNSDTDLIKVYKKACSSAKKVEFINPSSDAFNKAKQFLGHDMEHYKDILDWEKSGV